MNSSAVSRVGASEDDISKSIIVSPGPFCTVKRIYSGFSSKRRPRPAHVIDIMKKLEAEGLGAYQIVDRSGAFFKTIPNVLDSTKLAKYQVTAELNKQCFLKQDLKLSAMQKETLLEAHPNKEAVKEFFAAPATT